MLTYEELRKNYQIIKNSSNTIFRIQRYNPQTKKFVDFHSLPSMDEARVYLNNLINEKLDSDPETWTIVK